jgi:hypothetical protein
MRKLLILLITPIAFLGVGCTRRPETVVIATIQVTRTSTPYVSDIPVTLTAIALSREAERTQVARPLPSSIEEAKQLQTVTIRAGATSEEIIDTCGHPTSDEMLENFSPRVRRLLTYQDAGLVFGLTRNRLSDIWVESRYDGDVFGLRVGDQLQRAIAIYGMQGHESWPRGDKEIHHWPELLPGWFFETLEDRIVTIHMHNEDFYGDWETEKIQ